MKVKILFIFGTRPEAIKLAPLIKLFKDHCSRFETKICITSQHKSMLKQVLNLFNIVPDYDLKIMKKNQSLEYISSKTLEKLSEVFHQNKPDLIFVQGDTTTVMTASMAAFYQRIKIAHIEAGLRSYNKYSPFPEEINRVVTSHLADFHFAPTQQAKRNLLNEGICEENIWVTGNTVIDALFLTLKMVKQNEDSYLKYFQQKGIKFDRNVILVTGHRRENFGKGFQNICNALLKIANEDIEIIYPVHLNPNVQKPVNQILSNRNNIHLIKPLSYDKLVFLMKKSYLILTDSGGIQEEAPSLGKPVLVMRDVTERPEGIEAGTAKLVGTNKDNIVTNTLKLLNDLNIYKKMSIVNNPYGNGRASEYILGILNKITEKDINK
ncbi:MAG: UDP-N-acetylglucosamine 2-epimerase (non-hydrolyzing) [Actinobacteria bacterium]|nr:UDP-N-acetylglucosamine 2-epimerase (non-hydrolyzing) [Actinomycetota bacterium]